MELLNYLLKASACTTLFFAFYLLVLRRLTFFSANRFYLLISLALSFAIPLLKFTVAKEVTQVSMIDQPIGNPTMISNELSGNVPISIDRSFSNLDWYTVFQYSYFAIVTCFLLFAAWKLFKLIRCLKVGNQRVNGLKLVPKVDGFTNCSFFNYVFIDSNGLDPRELKVLLRHEEIHAKRYHSVDKLIMLAAKAFLWFNPIVYLYDKALEEVHEYEADEATSSSFGQELYASLLLKLAVSTPTAALTHRFAESPIKQRIKMLFNAKSGRFTKFAYLLMLPIGFGLIWILTVDVVYALPKDIEIAGQSMDEQTSRNLPTARLTNGISVAAEVEMQVQNGGSDRLVGREITAIDPKVTIDGKKYPSSILKRISPKCIRSIMVIGDGIKMTTLNKKVVLATPIEIENAKVEWKLDNSRFFIRYPQTSANGDKYDVVKLSSLSGSASAEVRKDRKVLILMGGKAYTEAEISKFTKAAIGNNVSVSIIDRTAAHFGKMYPTLVDKYDAVFQVQL
jgi:hypothetical protein